MNRDKECKQLEQWIPEKPSEFMQIVTNPMDTGKSWFVQEWAANRRSTTEKLTNKIGPVLYTDLRGVYFENHWTQALVTTVDQFCMKIGFRSELSGGV